MARERGRQRESKRDREREKTCPGKFGCTDICTSTHRNSNSMKDIRRVKRTCEGQRPQTRRKEKTHRQ
jgi:hypothetical protein